jgi:hypothetical protein
VTASTTKREELFKGKHIRRLVPPTHLPPGPIDLKGVRLSDYTCEEYCFVHVNHVMLSSTSEAGPSDRPPQPHAGLTPEALEPDPPDHAGLLAGGPLTSEFNLTSSGEIGQALEDYLDENPPATASESFSVLSPPHAMAPLAPVVAVIPEQSLGERVAVLEALVKAQQVQMETLGEQVRRLSERAAPVRASSVAHATPVHPREDH